MAVQNPAPVATLPSRREDAWKPAAAIAETFPRTHSGFGNQSALTSGTLRLGGGLVIPSGRTVSTITFCSATQALVTGSNQWFCLVDTALNVLGKTADDTSTAWAANTPKTLTLSAPYTPTADTPVYVGLLVVASTVPTLVGVNIQAANLSAVSPGLAGNSTTGLTTPASLGAAAAALTASAVLPYAYVS